MKQASPVPRQWAGSLVTLVASGTSLKPPDVAYLRGKCRVVVINDNYRLAPWADALYACDAQWWEHHQGCPDFVGQKWTQVSGPAQARKEPDVAARQAATAGRYGLKTVAGEFRAGLSLDRRLIHYGYNSGFQALNLAVHFGARRILLLGYDMQPGMDGSQHWFGRHPGTMNKPSRYADFRKAFVSALPDIAKAGVEVINCSRKTALECFPCARLEDVL